MTSPASKIVRNSLTKIASARRTFSILKGQGRPPLSQWVLVTLFLAVVWAIEFSVLQEFRSDGGEISRDLSVWAFRIILSFWFGLSFILSLPKLLLYGCFVLQIPVFLFWTPEWKLVDAAGVAFLALFFALKFFVESRRKEDTINPATLRFVGLCLFAGILIVIYYANALAPALFQRAIP